MGPQISYAQRYEDLHLLRCFGEQASGFYIDVGAGHPVYDNVSFVFYLRGWRGITVEPNPWLAELSGAVRPRDIRIQSLIGKEQGESTYYLVEDYHGLSTTVESHARAAQSELGKPSQAMRMPVTTLKALCAAHAPKTIDFLKIDVEGAERDVLMGGDWRRFRPKVVVLEALAPVTLDPSWQGWEPLLTGNDYRFAFFDTLNRYYVANEHGALAARLTAAPASFDDVTKFSSFRPALEDASHPDHRLAGLVVGTDMVRLPLLDNAAMLQLLTSQIPPGELDRTAAPADAVAVHERLFGVKPPPAWLADQHLSRDATICDLYRHIIAGERFKAACGRISASYAW